MALTALDHVVILVADIDVAIDAWCNKLGFTLTHRSNLADARVSQAFFRLSDQTFIELVAPTNSQSPVAKIIASKGEGIHVLALRVDDLDRSVADLQQREVKLVGVGTPQVFIDASETNGVMIQLWPKNRPHRWQQNPSEQRSSHDL